MGYERLNRNVYSNSVDIYIKLWIEDYSICNRSVSRKIQDSSFTLKFRGKYCMDLNNSRPKINTVDQLLDT